MHNERHLSWRAAENKKWGGIHDQHFHHYAEVSLGSEAFFTLFMLTGQFVRFEVRPLLFPCFRKMQEGKKALVSGYGVFFYCLFCQYCPLVLSGLGRKKPNASLPKQKKNQTPPAKLLNVHGLWVEAYSFLLYSLSPNNSQLAVTKSVVWISWSSFKLPYYYWLQSLGWSFLFLCANSGYLRLHKYLKDVVWLLRNVYLLSSLWP